MSVSTSTRVEGAITDRLLDGRLAPGEWLRQDSLATELSVSKIPVREALHHLVGEGVLRLEPNRGVVVPELNRADAVEIFALRASVEDALLTHAFDKYTIVDLAEAQHAIDRDDLSPTAANWMFHRALYQPAQWARGMRIAKSLHASVAGYVLRYVADLGGEDGSNREHAELLDECRRGDQASARRTLAEHLSTATDALISHLKDADATP